jgi:K+-transporting ATPase KdpF subunit
MLWRCCVYRGRAAYWTNYVGRNLYRIGFWIFSVVLHLCSRLRKALTKPPAKLMENIILGIISVALCGYLIFAMVRPEKF